MSARVQLFAGVRECRNAYARNSSLLAHGTHDQKSHGRRKGKRGPVGTDWASRLASGETSSRKPGDGTNRNSVELVEFGDGSRAIAKVSRADHDTAVMEFDAEQLGAKVAQAIGLAPPDVHRPEPTLAYFSHINDAHPDAQVGGEFGDWNIDLESKAARRIGLLDVLIENSDRHNANWFVADPAADDPDLIPIDHGYAWEETDRIAAHKIRQPHLFEHYLIEEVPIGELPDGYKAEDVYRFGDNDLSPAYVKELRGRLEGLRGEFEQAGRADWFERLMARVDLVAEHAKGAVSLA